jgi:hypothetical protein
MKVRTGFVSNSSTTSFIVVLKKDGDGRNFEIFDRICTVAGGGRVDINRRTIDKERAEILKKNRFGFKRKEWG